MGNAKLQIAQTQSDLAALLGLSLKQLTYWAYIAKPSIKFHSFTIPKKSGGERSIQAPNDFLRSVLQRLYVLLAEMYQPNAVVQGYVKSRSIITNSLPHVKKRYILNFDLENFFPSITFPRIRGLLLANPYGLTNAVATTIAEMCCFEGTLPQGAPTSPSLANMICGRMDRDLKRYVRILNCTYTRYADDVTISTSARKFPEELAVLANPPYGTAAILSTTLRQLVESNGFKVNSAKTRLQDQWHRQVVTGLVVNRFPNVRRSFIREVRLLLNVWEKHGLADTIDIYSAKHLRHYELSEVQFKRMLVGRLNYLSMVRGNGDPIYVRLAKRLRALDGSLVRGPLGRLEKIESALWIIETDLERSAGSENMAQGTAVMIEGIGLVTCDHVCCEPLVAYQARHPAIRHPVKVLKRNAHVDLAVLAIPVTGVTCLRIGDVGQVDVNTPVTIMGFPDHGPGSGVYGESGFVTQTVVRHGVHYFLVSMPIVQGASGSPVVNNSGDVVGIAVRGANSFASTADGNGERYGAILISELQQLME